MWKSSNTETVDEPAAAIWQKWTEVAKWPEQDASLVSASINGPFVVGSTITLKPKGSPSVKVTLVEVTPNKSFASVGKMPGAKLHFVHDILLSDTGTSFTQSVSMDGPLASLWAAMMGKKMASNLKARMVKMAQLIKQD